MPSGWPRKPVDLPPGYTGQRRGLRLRAWLSGPCRLDVAPMRTGAGRRPQGARHRTHERAPGTPPGLFSFSGCDAYASRGRVDSVRVVRELVHGRAVRVEHPHSLAARVVQVVIAIAVDRVNVVVRRGVHT